jgi:hypothetical protein
MKILSLTIMMALVVSLAWVVQAADAKKPEVLRHVVSFKFKDTASETQIKEVVDSFRALKSKITEIKSFEWGTNNSPEKLNKELTHCFILTFKSEKDRDAYLVHPAHKAFGGSLGPILADVMVIDFWVNQ